LAARLARATLLGSRLGDVLAILFGLLRLLCYRGPIATLRAEDRVDQLLAAHAPEALDAQLRRDCVEVGERALLELASCDHGHGETPPGRVPSVMRSVMLEQRVDGRQSTVSYFGAARGLEPRPVRAPHRPSALPAPSGSPR